MIRDKHVGYFIGPGFEDLEFRVPHMRLQEEGVQPATGRAGETAAPGV